MSNYLIITKHTPIAVVGKLCCPHIYKKATEDFYVFPNEYTVGYVEFKQNLMLPLSLYHGNREWVELLDFYRQMDIQNLLLRYCKITKSHILTPYNLLAFTRRDTATTFYVPYHCVDNTLFLSSGIYDKVKEYTVQYNGPIPISGLKQL
jgi:hypothetical protein